MQSIFKLSYRNIAQGVRKWTAAVLLASAPFTLLYSQGSDVSGLTSAPSAFEESPSPKCEVRATWLTTLGGMDWPRAKATNAAGVERQKRELTDILDRLQHAGFNTVLMQTRLRGDVIYPSAIETWAESLTGHTGQHPGYDPLAFAIEECHRRGMELHAWVVTIPVGNTRQVKLLGKQSVVKKQRALCKLFKDSWYLDPGNPATETYLSSLVKEIVSRYDVDGIHFDYIRYPEQGEKFPDSDTFRRYGKGKDLRTWRRDNVTRIVRRLYTDIKALKPWVKVTSAPVGKFQDTNRYPSKGWNAYSAVYQDAQGWLREGIHDGLFPMMYFRGNHFYPFAIDWQEHACGRWIVPGLGVYFLSEREGNWPLDEVVRQIAFSRRIGLQGEAFFRNRFLLDNVKGVLDELEERIYCYPAAVPPMTWMGVPAPAAPTEGKYTLLPDGRITLEWKEAAPASEGIYYRLYASNSYPIDTNDGRNLLEVRWEGDTYEFRPQSPWELKRHYAVTAVNRYGMESEVTEFTE
jgi:uncharacterized lipoprotein YddW (UPF0748 family)